MHDEVREFRDSSPLVFSWGMPGSEVAQEPMEAAAAWMTGGLLLALWTGVALLLTGA